MNGVILADFLKISCRSQKAS